jgi:hypothetical protein
LKVFLVGYPGFSQCSNPGLKLANACGVIITGLKLAKRLRRYYYRAEISQPPAALLSPG